MIFIAAIFLAKEKRFSASWTSFRDGRSTKWPLIVRYDFPILLELKKIRPPKRVRSPHRRMEVLDGTSHSLEHVYASDLLNYLSGVFLQCLPSANQSLHGMLAEAAPGWHQSGGWLGLQEHFVCCLVAFIAYVHSSTISNWVPDRNLPSGVIQQLVLLFRPTWYSSVLFGTLSQV